MQIARCTSKTAPQCERDKTIVASRIWGTLGNTLGFRYNAYIHTHCLDYPHCSCALGIAALITASRRFGCEGRCCAWLVCWLVLLSGSLPGVMSKPQPTNNPPKVQMNLSKVPPWSLYSSGKSIPKLSLLLRAWPRCLCLKRSSLFVCLS